MKPITSLSDLDLNGIYTDLNWRLEQAVELIKGKIFPISPTPSMKYQRTSWQISYFIADFLKNKECRTFSAPSDVRLLDKRKSKKAGKGIYTVIQPDISVICNKNKLLLDERGYLGSPDLPDLIVEILFWAILKKK